MNKTLLPAIIVVLLALAALPVSAAPNPASGDTPYYRVEAVTLADGRQLEKVIIGGPPRPPLGATRPTLAAEAALSAEAVLPSAQNLLLGVPAYQWSFGCSATSAAMIAAYYDRGAYANMYTGPTGGGLMPMSSSVWGFWFDALSIPLAQCPLTASRAGLDGRTARGSVDDYFISIISTAPDPYIGNWTEHTWGDAIGDYMKTSQSAFGNVDGATTFYRWKASSDPLTCEDMLSAGIQNDGTVGRKQFYEARGYTVTACYNQPTGINKGFMFANYKAEIDAGRPVLINYKGHSVVGVGYDDDGRKIYIHDTWDQSVHVAKWSDSYAGMDMESVSIVNLGCAAAGSVGGLAIALAAAPDVTLAWDAVPAADHYEVWSATNEPYFEPGADCANPAPYACQTVAAPPLTTPALGSVVDNNTFVVRAVGECGSSPAVLQRAGEFEFALVTG